ncbi:hypothetical protein [Streptacidiphilus anmyonensis]|uniref:hypothetical protein n=1 Tax=Streptacidiphilus anmyonensis TaxID=405782 RepID=UPI0005AB2481|nr:hypothetical protein [Streptacidiphilus anmyonensis]
MERATTLGSLATRGEAVAPQRLAELAAEFDIPVADLLVVAGHPVPEELLPPERDGKAVRAFAYRVSHCGHAQLTVLDDYVRSLPRVAPAGGFVQTTSPRHPPATTGFAAVLGGLIRNRGFGIRELPFMGLSLSTLYGMTSHWGPSPHRPQQLCAVAGPLGWTLSDLFAVAAEPYSQDFRPMMHCRHLGRVLTAAAPLGTAQLVQAAKEADRLSVRADHGAWRPVAQGFAADCPDFA